MANNFHRLEKSPVEKALFISEKKLLKPLPYHKKQE